MQLRVLAPLPGFDCFHGWQKDCGGGGALSACFYGLCVWSMIARERLTVVVYE